MLITLLVLITLLDNHQCIYGPWSGAGRRSEQATTKTLTNQNQC